ncbi:MAG: Sec-independent protein translocase protein TatB [Xanthomonadales bacterium]|nr:Sec-independent protein translocase protein TatB [Xanthomonadales bacterium]
MFDVGFAEIFLLALIGLLVLGPERLPGVARTVGGFVRKARMSWISLRNTIESELAEADIAEPIKKTSEELKQIGKTLTESPVFDSEKLTLDSTEPDPVAADESSPDLVKKPDSGKPEDV